jgi:cytoskeleton protein RodZ
VEEANVRVPAPDLAAAALPSLPMKVDTPVSVRINSWVELRAPNGDVLAQTYVRAGESYTVPAGIAYRIIEAR